METSKYIVWAEKVLGGISAADKESFGDQSTVFMIRSGDKSYFLKIGSDLEKERVRLEWLKGRLPVPEVIGFITIDERDALILSAIEGKNLAALKKEWSAEKVVDALVDAVRAFHAVDMKECPFGTNEPGKVLVHGDACLPNFIFQENGIFSGYIDVGDVTMGDPETDLSAAVWSLQYNLGAGYGKTFLEKYGMKNVTDETVEKLRLRYESMQDAWGLSK